MLYDYLSAEEILSDLIEINTVSALSNLELIKYIENYLSKLGLESEQRMQKYFDKIVPDLVTAGDRKY